MPLTDEQAKQIKEQLLPQIKQLPEEQQAQAKQYIEGMNNEQLEEFLKQNQIAMQQQGQQPQQAQTTSKAKGTKCVFCSIAKKEMQSFALYEDKDYLAALEINPFSKGHTLLIPKKHIKQTKSLPTKAYNLANRVGKHIVKKLKAESFQVTTSAELGHAIINIIPTYKKQPLTYERTQKKPEELQELAIKIGEVTKRKLAAPKPKSIKISKKKAEEAIIKLPRRIP